MTQRFAYPDTCVLLPLFIEEQGSTVAQRMAMEFTKGGELPILVSDATRLEFIAVISRNVRTHLLTKEQAQQVITAFEHECENGFLTLPVQVADFRMAYDFIARLDTSLRTLDALHLAIAHTNKCTLLTADKQLAAAAAMLEVEHYFVPFA